MNLQRHNHNHHVVITGTGRAGTTALVQLFTDLGMPTGYNAAQAQEVDAVSMAGLEDTVSWAQRPYIVKTPWLLYTMENVLRSGIVIDCAIVPMRDISDVAASRHRVCDTQAQLGHPDPQRAPGSLMPQEHHGDQQSVLAVKHHEMMCCLARHEIPVCLLSFPQFVQDWQHCYRSLQPVFDSFEITAAAVQQSHQRVLDPDLIHSFATGDTQ